MPVKKCSNGKYKIGEKGKCMYDSKKKQKKPIKPIWLKRIIKGKDRKIKKDLKTPKYRMRVVEDKKKKADKLYCRTKTRRNKYND